MVRIATPTSDEMSSALHDHALAPRRLRQPFQQALEQVVLHHHLSGDARLPGTGVHPRLELHRVSHPHSSTLT